MHCQNKDCSFELHHLGGEKTVTGSCHLLRCKGLNILIDCGLTQGRDQAISMTEWPVPPAEIDYLFLTHTHLDHVGRLPQLFSQGFQGEIIATHATVSLLAPMLRDAMGVQGMSGREIEDLQQKISRQAWGFEYGTTFDLPNGIRFKLGRAGHILGSCFIRLEWQSPEYSIVFSGDLGAAYTPLLPDPDPVEACDLLVLESTYGDRLHENRQNRITCLGQVLNRALSDRGKVYIPAFALGRTQELLYEIDRLRTDPQLSRKFSLPADTHVPVVVDSPLGLELTEIYQQQATYWDQEARALLGQGDNPLDFSGLYSAKKFRDHQRLLEMDGPCVIIAGSGMCTGGRIVDHLLANLQDERNDILFVGYQAQGTPGRDILEYAGKPGGYVMLDGQRRQIRAKVHRLTGYSAHADQRDLINWVQTMGNKPGAVKLVHGEPAAQMILAEKLRNLDYHVL